VLSTDSPIAARRRMVASYLYVFTRTLELGCSWTMAVPNMALKTALGRKIGLDGLAIERLSRRITQMLTPTANGAAPEAFVRWLDAHHAETDGGRIASVLVATIDALAISMKRYVAEARAGDEPTWLLLRTLLLDLELGRQTLAPFATTPVVAPELDAKDAPLVSYEGTEPLLPVPSFPARPDNYVRAPEEFVKAKLTLQQSMEPAQIVEIFRRAYIEVEISAIEVCARNVVEYRAMPSAFKVDMSQQIWDEARHAELAISVLQKYGAELGDVRYSGRVWMRHAMGDNLEERLAIEQCIQEGNSVDKNWPMIGLFRRFEHHEAAEALEWLVADETQHAAIGNRWLLWLCDGHREKYEAVLKLANEKIKFPLWAVNRELRVIGSYPDWYIDKLQRELDESKRERAGVP
jgi:uncharacterized ferritin-like protein (DUF455 family)